MKQGIWQEIEALHQEFLKLGIGEAVDYEKYYLYSLIVHSTAIEGSTLTEVEAQLLFDEGVVAGGKPLVYHLMNEDFRKFRQKLLNYAAYYKNVLALLLPFENNTNLVLMPI